MKKGLRKNILIALFLALALFFTYDRVSNYISLLKNRISGLEKQEQNLLKTLGKERAIKEKLSQQNSQLQESLKLNQDKIDKLTIDYEASQRTVEDLNSQCSLLKAENSALLEQQENMKLRLSQTYSENENMKTKLGSIPELKKAIRELKIQAHNAKKAQVRQGAGKKSNVITQKTQNTQETDEGNQGFLVRDGRIIYPTVKIEVKPVPEKE